MITAYRQFQGRIQPEQLSLDSFLPQDCIWLDVLEPSDEERQWLDRYFLEELPDVEDLNEIEASSRFFTDKDGLHIHSFFPHRIGKEIRNYNVSFNLRPNMLVTMRDEQIGLFRLMRSYMKREHVEVESPIDILLLLFTTKVDYLADQLEEVYESLEEVSHQVLLEDDNEVSGQFDRNKVLRQITIQEDFNGKIRLNLMDSERSLRYLLRSRRRWLEEEQQQQIRDMLRDIDSLLPHTAFLFEKVNFLLDATMGFINLEQSKIIKIFSVAAVVFLPPTVIASAYGMNFAHMPELDWTYGYPMSIGLMVLSAFSTYLFFKRKGWL